SEVPTEFVTKSGEIRYALWSAEVIDYGGKLVMLSLLYDVTERKRAEEELFNAHALIEGITKGTEDLIAAEDHEFRYLYFNDAYRREFKKLWGQELAIGTSMVEAMASWPEDQKRARDLWQRALNGETFKINMEFGPSKPEKQTYELQFNPVVDGEGRQIGAAHILRNVTEQVRLRDELHQRAAELEAALESLAEGVVFYDTGHMIVRMNTMALQILGFSEEDVRLPASERIKLFQIRTKEGRIPNREDLVGWRALQDEVVINDEMLVKPKGKDEFIHILTSAAPIKRPDGQIIGAIQTLNDISALKNSEQALRESQEKFSKAFFGNPGFMFISKAENGQFIEFNDAYCDLTGYSRKEMLGRTSTELGIISPDAREKLKQAILSREKTRNLEIKITRKSGETRDTIFSVDYVNLGGTPSFICSGFDITERKRIEENLRTLTNELEHRVNERTKELEQANRAKDEFLANMSHEIRTPMAGVLGLTEILLHQALPADVEADLKMIRSSAKSVLTLLNDMFDLSRINQGKFDFHPTEFELRSMVDKAIGPFRYQAKAKDLDFAISLDENIPNQILCDKDRLAQVLKNLVSNAIKFTKQGFVHVEMKAEALDDDTLRLAVSVSDSGIGIPRGKQKDIFNAFTQLDSSYSKNFAGMGLGLAISKSLVQGMGGEISVDSIEGEGSTFSFFVTCGWASQEEISAVEKMSLSTLPPMTVLLVEDNPVNRLFLRRALVTAGHKVGEAKDGKHALAKLVGSPYDLILMDIQMPVMDGIEATRQIRSGGYGREDIPIIALTAYAMKGDREKFLAEGMNGYVTKPVDFGELARTIAETCALEVTKP
ncbi:MAG: PAS domain S-box protein, partial [Desulfovibrionales bacterium]